MGESSSSLPLDRSQGSYRQSSTSGRDGHHQKQQQSYNRRTSNSREHVHGAGHNHGRGKYETFTSPHVPPSVIHSQPWRRTSSVPKPVILPSMRSEGLAPASSGNDLLVDPQKRQELEKQIEEQLRASDIGVSWADEDEEIDLSKDPFAENGNIVDSNQFNGAKENNVILINKEEDSMTKKDFTPVPPREEREGSDTKASTATTQPMTNPPSWRSHADYYNSARSSDGGSFSSGSGRNIALASSSPKTTSTKPEMITRYITVKLRVDADEEVIPVKLPKRS